MCSRCRRLQQKMCRGYHNTGVDVEKAYADDTISHRVLSNLAAKEIEERLLYEYVFGILTEADIKSGEWLKGGMRDYGHTTRVRKLYRLCQMGDQRKKYWFQL